MFDDAVCAGLIICAEGGGGHHDVSGAASEKFPSRRIGLISPGVLFEHLGSVMPGIDGDGHQHHLFAQPSAQLFLQLGKFEREQGAWSRAAGENKVKQDNFSP